MQGLKNPLARHPGLVISTFGLAEIISCMPDGLVKIYISDVDKLVNIRVSTYIHICYTVLPRSIAPRFIANLAYRQNSRLSRFPPLKIPSYTAKLSNRHPPQVFRHKSRKTNLNSLVSTAHNYLLTAVY